MVYVPLSDYLHRTQYIDGRWICDAQIKPKLDPSSNNQAYCCPSGWTISIFNDPMPCVNELDLYKCGPLPANTTTEDVVCCHTAGQWVGRDPSGKDSCAPYEPLKASQILAPDILVPTQTQQIVTPGLLLASGLAVLMMIILIYIR